MKYCPELNEFLGNNKKIQGQIPQVMWHITDICALKCPYCFSTKTEEATNLKDASKIVDLLATAGCQKIDIAGGEPLSHSYLENLCMLVWDKNVHTTITTSGVGKHKNKKFLLDHCDQFSRVIVSLDGPKNAHNNIRRYANAWEQAVEIIQSLPNPEKKKRLRINTVITRQFIEGNWLPIMAEFIESIEIHEWCLIQPHPANKKDGFDFYSSGLEDLEKEYTRALSLIENTKVLKREASLYSTYWVLYPSGKLSQHTNGGTDSASISLINCNKNQLMPFINHTETKVP